MNVLSLFDGLAGARIALERTDLKVDNYYASEIDKYCIQIANKNYSDITQLGSIEKWRQWKLPKIDLLIGGFPCQGFSYAGKGLNFNDPRSKLFFTLIDILNYYKPSYFILENVRMKKEWSNLISKYLKVNPIEINSSLVSAQDRRRLYWTNIPNVNQPKDRKIFLKDIIDSCVDSSLFLNDEQLQKIKYLKGSKCEKRNKNGFEYFYKEGSIEFPNKLDGKSQTLTTQCGYNQRTTTFVDCSKRSIIIYENEIKRRKIGYIGTDSQGNRIYSTHNKSICLCGGAGGLGAKTGLYAVPCLTSDRINKKQSGRGFKSPHNKFYTLTTIDKQGVLTNNFIRKLTPIECERLQTIPNNYTKGVSNTQRYKMIGNSFTIDIIVHILSFIS